MFYSTKEALRILQESGLTECKDQQVLLKWIREGKIPAFKKSKRSGYRIKTEDLDFFIQKNNVDVLTDSPFSELDLLRKENDRLKKEMNESILMKHLTELRMELGRVLAENQTLKTQLRRCQKN